MIKKILFIHGFAKEQSRTLKHQGAKLMDSRWLCQLATAYLAPEVHVHDMYPFHFLHNIPGLLNGYPSRGMIYPHVAVVCASSTTARANIEACHAHHLQSKVGASKLVIGNNPDLSHTIARSENLRRVVLEYTSRGYSLDFFIRRDVEELPQSLGLRSDQITSPDPQLAAKLDNKLSVRQVLGSEFFTPWRYVSDRESLDRAIGEVVEECQTRRLPETDTVFLKRPGFDGGDGVLRVSPRTSSARLSKFLAEHLHHGLLIDAGYPSDTFQMEEVSVVLMIGDHTHSVLFPTNQITVDDAHVGNRISLGENVIDSATWNMIRPVVDEVGKYAVNLGIGQDRMRTIGVDLIVVKFSGQIFVFILEVNARKIAGDSAGACAMQVLPRFSGRVAVILVNSRVPIGMTYQDVQERVINGRAYDGSNRPGIELANAASLEDGKVSMYFIGGTLSEADALRAEHDAYVASETRRGHLPPVV